ncbi:MAG: hypothetical protein ABSC19_05020 [Syntrophorhabdales bacterium]|jgi:hypothetical protein
MRTEAPLKSPLFSNQPGSAIGDPSWVEWYQRLSDYYTQVLRYTDPYHPQFGKVEPPHVTGMMAYADNVNWKPGTQAGYYRWSGSAWQYIG